MNNPHIDTGVHIGRVTIERLTDRALLCVLPDGSEKWVPKSQLHPESEIQDYALINEEGELVITDWLKRKWDGG
jgi:hypothetical protein